MIDLASAVSALFALCADLECDTRHGYPYAIQNLLRASAALPEPRDISSDDCVLATYAVPRPALSRPTYRVPTEDEYDDPFSDN
ncbi:MAG: hypothetical protein ACRYFS_24465 [Janthinobacterium lividum]